jgi:hypothetical protein
MGRVGRQRTGLRNDGRVPEPVTRPRPSQIRAGVFLALNVARHISLSVFTRAHAAREGANGGRDPHPRPSIKARWAKLFGGAGPHAGFYGRLIQARTAA